MERTRNTRYALAAAGLAGVVALALVACKPPPPPPLPPATPTPVPTPTPIPALVRKPLPTATLFNGLSLEAAVVAEPDGGLASAERVDNDAYTVEVTLRARLPRPAATLEELVSNDPTLPGALPKLPVLLEGATVSPFHPKFYELKTNDLRRRLSRLDAVLSRHNFYDCETMLELEDPDTSRKALLVIADMDVNTDGSDGDRNVTVDGSSEFFLPQTSYRWPKRTDRENPFLAGEKARLAKFQEALKEPGMKKERVAEINAGIDLAKRRIHDLTKWSFLISSVDPFIVLPGFIMRDHKGPFVPKIGDYAVVFYKGAAYPAILGDSGPSHKAGEASVLLCMELNNRSSQYSRPVSSLKVSYLIFPGTAEATPGPPDLAKWRDTCQRLVDEMGGLGVALHEWPNLVEPWPTPTPEPTPSPVTPPDPQPAPAAEESSSAEEG